jgi:hypothetical protein
MFYLSRPNDSVINHGYIFLFKKHSSLVSNLLYNFESKIIMTFLKLAGKLFSSVSPIFSILMLLLKSKNVTHNLQNGGAEISSSY